MNKLIFALLAIVILSPACFCMGGSAPSSSYNGQPTKTLIGNIESVKTLKNVERLVVVDNTRSKTTVDYVWGTTPFDANGNWPMKLNSRVQIKYFVRDDGRNIALTAKEINKTR